MNITAAPKKKGEKIELHLINSDNTVSGSLGISDERRDELCEIIEKQYEKKIDNITADLAVIAAHTTNHEELVFVSFVYGLYVQDNMQSSTPLAALQSFLERKN